MKEFKVDLKRTHFFFSKSSPEDLLKHLELKLQDFRECEWTRKTQSCKLKKVILMAGYQGPELFDETSFHVEILRVAPSTLQ